MTVFKKAVGMTMHQALTGHRLDTVQSLLISSERPIASVAFENAFGSLSRFYAAFESRFETTPSKCRDGFVSSLRS
jgi:transcriptional regulator GlxA family with amidase domain